MSAKVIYAAVFAFASILALRALLTYSFSLSGRLEIDSAVVSAGFAHPRFFGQIGTLVIPILLAPFLSVESSPAVRRLTRVLVVSMWVMVFASGTRGSVLALALGGLVAFVNGPVWRLWVREFVQLLFIGFLVYLVTFEVVPFVVELPSNEFSASLWRGGVTGREVLWFQALQMIQSSPLLGAGPMHFAAQINQVGAHPHQSILQVVAEWGVPAAMLFFATVLMGFRVFLKLMRGRRGVEDFRWAVAACLSMALMCAGFQSMVDGVIVVPYTQLWVAIAVGGVFGLFPRCIQSSSPSGVACRRIQIVFFVASVLWLVAVVVRDAPDLDTRAADYLAMGVDDHLRPRFWSQGVIVD